MSEFVMIGFYLPQPLRAADKDQMRQLMTSADGWLDNKLAVAEDTKLLAACIKIFRPAFDVVQKWAWAKSQTRLPVQLIFGSPGQGICISGGALNKRQARRSVRVICD